MFGVEAGARRPPSSCCWCVLDECECGTRMNWLIPQSIDWLLTTSIHPSIDQSIRSEPNTHHKPPPPPPPCVVWNKQGLVGLVGQLLPGVHAELVQVQVVARAGARKWVPYNKPRREYGAGLLPAGYAEMEQVGKILKVCPSWWLARLCCDLFNIVHVLCVHTHILMIMCVCMYT